MQLGFYHYKFLFVWVFIYEWAAIWNLIILIHLIFKLFHSFIKRFGLFKFFCNLVPRCSSINSLYKRIFWGWLRWFKLPMAWLVVFLSCCNFWAPWRLSCACLILFKALVMSCAFKLGFELLLIMSSACLSALLYASFVQNLHLYNHC